MIISSDFITNSSSSSYILKIPNETTCIKFREYINELPKTVFKGIRLFQTFINKEKLTEFAQQKECDWVSKVMGPSEYISLNINEYIILRRAIEEKKSFEIIGYLDISWGRQYDSVKVYCSKNSIKMVYLMDD
jgi:hypothetical protein